MYFGLVQIPLINKGLLVETGLLSSVSEFTYVSIRNITSGFRSTNKIQTTGTYAV
jgi:hypothetical protein